MLVYSVKRWEGYVDLAGKSIPCTEDTIRALCESDYSTMFSMLSKILDAGRAGKLLAEKN
jgi:hypothetical protein